jgi:hypothetical protein
MSNQELVEQESPVMLPEEDDVEEESFDSEETFDGTEYEDTSIKRPFDPTQIKLDTRQMSLDTILERIRENEIDLSPDFQRAEVWKPAARSRLIESLLIRIPLPAFYVDATDENHWLVIDGLQRLSTLRDFVIKKTMKLKDLEFLTDFDKLKYDDLPRSYQRRIRETQVTVYQIERGTPSDVKFNIFKRINTGGMPLSSQEIRHALNQGPVTLFLKALADSREFRVATWNSISDTRMARRECVLRFLAYTLTSPEDYKSGDFDAFLSDTMAALNKMTDEEREELSIRFYRALSAAAVIFGEAAFRKPKVQKRSPVNKALFEVWTIALDRQSDEDIDKLKGASTHVKNTIVDFMRNDREFMDAVSQGTGDAAKVRLRFSRFQKKLEECLND